MSFDGLWVVALYLFITILIHYYYYHYYAERERERKQEKVGFSEFQIQVGFADKQVAGFGK